MPRKRSAFEKWVGPRLYLYYLASWILTFLYALSLWTKDVQCFQELVPTVIGMTVSILVPFFILVCLDYLVFKYSQRQWKSHGEIVLNLEYSLIPLSEYDLSNQGDSVDETKEETGDSP